MILRCLISSAQNNYFNIPSRRKDHERKERMGRVYLVTGGCRSGKSSFAQRLSEQLSPRPIYLATAQSFDSDFSNRIERHQADRGDHWTTIEEELALSKHCDKFHHRVVLVDCLTLWLTNFMMAEGAFNTIDRENSEEINDSEKQAAAGDDLLAPERALARAKEEFEKLVQPWDATYIFVTNEIGSGTHAAEPMTRKFVDCQGWLNQHVAKRADRVYLLVAGIPTLVKEPPMDSRATSIMPPSKEQLEEAKMVDVYLSTRSCIMDDKGYFLISIDSQKKRIVAKFFSSMLNDKGEVCDLHGNKIKCCGDDTKNQRPEPMIVFEGRTAKELTVKLLEEWEPAEETISPAHAAYLGREFQRAEHCLFSGSFYQQD